MAPWMRYDAGAQEWRRLSSGLYVPPSTGSKQNLAVIGDSTIFQSGPGPANLLRQLEALGWDAEHVWIYAVSGKPLWSADSTGKTFADNVTEARNYFSTRGGEPTWLINLGANNSGSSDATNSTQISLALNLLDDLGADVFFTGLSQANSYDATARNRFNRLAKRAVDRRPHMLWCDWHRVIKSYDDSGYWNADGVHNNTAGYLIKNAWLASIVGRPTDLPSLSLRPEGPGFQTYESTYVSGDTLQGVVNRVTPGNVLTFPEGRFTYRDFANGGGFDGVRMGTTTDPRCRGFAGSGPNTIFGIEEGSSTKSLAADKYSSLAQFHVWGQRRPVFQNFTLEGTEQGHIYNGLSFSLCYSPTVFGVRMVAPNVGTLNEPPGETFGVRFWQSDNGAIIDSTWDGRRGGEGGPRVATSPFGWNTSKNAYVRNFIARYSLAGMPTFWETTDIHTVDLVSEFMGSGSGKVNGQGINHEKVGGVITHVRPVITINRAGGNTGLHTSINNSTGAAGSPSFGNADDIVFYDVTHDAGPTGGTFSVQTSKGYHPIDGVPTQTQTSYPTVTKNGVTLTPRDAAAGTTNPNPAAEFFRYQ